MKKKEVSADSLEEKKVVAEKAASKKAKEKTEYNKDLEQNNLPKAKAAKVKKEKPAKADKKKTEGKETESKPKKKFNSRSLVSIIVLFVLGISSGVFAGKWYATNFIAGPATDYSLFSEVELREGNDTIASQFATKVPTEATAWKSLIAAESNFYTASSFDILSNGLVDTIVTQDVYARKIYNGTTIVVEQISDGMVAVADKFEYKPSLYNDADKATHIVRTKGKLNGKKTIAENLLCLADCKHGNKKAYIYSTNYNGKQTTMTEQEYKEAMGGNPISPYAYIISEKTITKCYNFKKQGSGENTRYTFTINLHPGASVLNYVKQMKTVSGLSDFPNFTEITLNVSLQMLGGKVMFDYICVNEKYSVAYGALTPKCTGTLHQRFLFNGDYTISE